MVVPIGYRIVGTPSEAETIGRSIDEYVEAGPTLSAIMNKAAHFGYAQTLMRPSDVM